MSIDWTAFTPWSALAGGAIIACAAALFALGNGRVAGISGIVAVAGQRRATLLGTPMLLPTARAIDGRLVVGSVLFGAGRGLAGFCPGPALVALGAGHLKALVFVAAMVAGVLVFEWIERARGRSAEHPEGAAAGASE